MRLALGGYGGPPPPLNPTDLDNAPYVPKDPAIVLTMPSGYVFEKAQYVTQGYTRYDVICIGGSGGAGGSWRGVWSFMRIPNLITEARGGGGGGGGVHRKRGLLSRLPRACGVVVGGAGADAESFDYGIFNPITPPAVADGGNGGASTFGGLICRASGGTGGKAASRTAGSGNYDSGGASGGQGGAGGGEGGEGGVGARTASGGGARGGVWSPDPNASNGGGGAWNGTATRGGTIGQGGGGGKGGQAVVANSVDQQGRAQVYFYARAGLGGVGNWSPAEPLTAVPYELPSDVNYFGRRLTLIPGFGGGGKSFWVDETPRIWGSRWAGQSGGGCVIIRIT